MPVSAHNLTIRASLAPRYTLFFLFFGQGQLELCLQPFKHYFWSFLVKVNYSFVGNPLHNIFGHFCQGQLEFCWHPVTHYFWLFRVLEKAGR